MAISINSQRVILTLSSLIAICVLYIWIIPYASSYFPRSLEVWSNSLHVVGKYYPLTLDGATSVSIKKNTLVVEGFNLGWMLNTIEQPSIIRTLPKEFSSDWWPDSSWKIVHTIGKYNEPAIVRFTRSNTNDTTMVKLPTLGGEPRWVAYRCIGDSTLIVMASGNWKQGEKAFLEYVLISKNKSF